MSDHSAYFPTSGPSGIQCKMVVIKEGLWKIVTGEEVAPTGSAAEKLNFFAKRDRAWLILFCQDPADPTVILGKVNWSI